MLKNRYIFSNKTAINKNKNMNKIELVTSRNSTGYKVAEKRCIIGLQKGTFCKSIRRLLEAKRAWIDFEVHENSLQTSIDKGISCL